MVYSSSTSAQIRLSGNSACNWFGNLSQFLKIAFNRSPESKRQIEKKLCRASWRTDELNPPHATNRALPNAEHRPTVYP